MIGIVKLIDSDNIKAIFGTKIVGIKKINIDKFVNFFILSIIFLI